MSTVAKKMTGRKVAEESKEAKASSKKLGEKVPIACQEWVLEYVTKKSFLPTEEEISLKTHARWRLNVRCSNTAPRVCLRLGAKTPFEMSFRHDEVLTVLRP